MFSFPALPGGAPSRRNWYRELLDHPDCQGRAIKVQEAYESFRTQSLEQRLNALEGRTTNSNASNGDANANDADAERQQQQQPLTPTPPSHLAAVPDKALLAHLARAASEDEREWRAAYSLQDVNCEGFWARPPGFVIGTIQRIQRQLRDLVGDDIYTVPATDLHLSVLELSHRHPVAHLQGVLDQVSPEPLRSMLDLPHTLVTQGPPPFSPSSAKSKSSSSSSSPPLKGIPPPRLVHPKLLFDGSGVVLTFVPAASASASSEEEEEEEKYKYTYHHLRADLQTLALSSGLDIDTCYTAPLAHITLARTLSARFFEKSAAAEDEKEKDVRRKRYAALVRGINAELREEPWAETGWVVGGHGKGLECQMGYVKWGRGTEWASAVGKPAGEGSEHAST